MTHESYLASSRVFENAIETTFANFEIKEEGSDAVDKVAAKVRLENRICMTQLCSLGTYNSILRCVFGVAK